MISVIVPCYNEEQNIEAMYRRLQKALEKEDYEIIFVDDGSRDSTYTQLRDIQNKNDKNVSVISLSRNFGKEAAIYAGLHYMNGEYGAIIDADLQQPPELIVEMLDYLEQNSEYDIVALYQEKRVENKCLSFFKHAGYRIMNKLCEVDFRDGASDFRIFRKCVSNALLSMPEYFRFSKGLFAWVGFNTYYKPYVAEKRYRGTSKWSIAGLIRYGLEGILAFSTFPLRIGLYLGVAVSGGAFVYMLINIIEHFMLKNVISGYSTIVCLILILGGVQTMLLGIIGEYLAKTYIQGKNRPIFIEKNIILTKDSLDKKAEN